MLTCLTKKPSSGELFFDTIVEKTVVESNVLNNNYFIHIHIVDIVDI